MSWILSFDATEIIAFVWSPYILSKLLACSKEAEMIFNLSLLNLLWNDFVARQQRTDAHSLGAFILKGNTHKKIEQSINKI